MSAPLDSRERRQHAFETKFLVAKSVGTHIREWAADHLDPDPYGGGESGDEYHTTSVYFDTDRFDVFHRRGSFGRAKYRVRRYGQLDFVFLERKLRTAVLLAKRRTSVPLEDLRHATHHGHSRWPGAWFLDRLELRHLVPKCEVSYQRIARVTSSEHGVTRLTIDRDLGATLVNALSFGDRHRVPCLTDQVIVELKYRVAMPALFKRLVERFALTPVRVSKYRLALSALVTACSEATRDSRRLPPARNERGILWEPWSPDAARVPPVRPGL